MALRRFGLSASVAIVATILLAAPAFGDLEVVNPDDPTDVRTIDANLDIQPNTTGNAFFQAVQDCLDELKNHTDKAQILVDLVNSGNDHTISETDRGSTNTTSPPTANESNGMGTGSSTRWNPNNNAFPNGYADGSPRDPCAALLHELVHAHDKDNGVMDRTQRATNDTGDTVRESEIRACKMQNWLHQAKGIACRTQYGDDELPLGIQFDKCPDRICIFAGDGNISYPVVDEDDLYYEVPVAGQDPSPVEGKEIEIRDAQGMLVGKVTLIKQLDGQVVIRVEAEPGQILEVTQVQWKNDGQPLTMMPQDVPMPPRADPTNPEDESGEMDLPAVGVLGIVKGPDDVQAAAGGMVTFTITVTNKGTIPLMNVMVTDPLFPACNFTVANLAAGASETRMCTVTVGMATFTNRAQVVGQTAGGQNVGTVHDDCKVNIR